MKRRDNVPIGLNKKNQLLDSEGFFSTQDIYPHAYDMVLARDANGKEAKGWWTGEEWEVRPKIAVVKWQPFLRWDTAAGRSRLDHTPPKWKNFLDK